MGRYEKLDIALVALIRQGRNTRDKLGRSITESFKPLLAELECDYPATLVDRRLQVLRKAGKVYWAGKWYVYDAKTKENNHGTSRPAG